jgi:hypothetical protein
MGDRLGKKVPKVVMKFLRRDIGTKGDQTIRNFPAGENQGDSESRRKRDSR